MYLIQLDACLKYKTIRICPFSSLFTCRFCLLPIPLIKTALPLNSTHFFLPSHIPHLGPKENPFFSPTEFNQFHPNLLGWLWFSCKMGSCCSTGERIEGSMAEERHNEKKTRLKKEDDRIDIPNSDCAGANARVEGSSRFISMFTQQGRKGINQDAMTVLEVKKN